jgi:hypothetical protein
VNKHIVTAVVAIVFITGGGWFGFKRYRCQHRSAAFRRRIENIRADAHEQLKIGTARPEVSRFFSEHNIPFEIVNSEAYGTLQTTGCAPIGCGTDEAIIGVRVQLDATGSVTNEPKVVDMYTNCL